MRLPSCSFMMDLEYSTGLADGVLHTEEKFLGINERDALILVIERE
jgi:hypothetical protein